MVNTSYMAKTVNSYSQNARVKTSTKDTPMSATISGGTFAEKTAEKSALPCEGETQKNVSVKNNSHEDMIPKEIIANEKNTQEKSARGMTLEEYKKYIHQKIDSLYTHPSQRGMCRMIEITDAAYERMMNDPEYEEKVLNMLAADKARYYGRFIPMFVYTRIDDTWENTYTKTIGWRDRQPPRNISRNEKSWWDERQERIKEMLKRQAKAAQKRAQAQSILGRQAALERQMESQQTRQILFAEKIPGESSTVEQLPFSSSSAKALAASFYAEALSIFSEGLVRKKN